jgi:CRP-like cAMP-binding protein
MSPRSTTRAYSSSTEADRERRGAVDLKAWHEVMSATVSLPTDAHLFHQGDEHRNVYILERGVVKLMVVDASGRQSILALVHAPAFLGGGCALADLPSPVAAVTASASDFRWCCVPAFRSAIERAPVLLLDLYRLQCVQMIELFEALTMLKQRSSKQRLAMFLERLELAQQEATPPPAEPAHTLVALRQFEVASLLGISPEHLSRIRHTAEGRGSLKCAKLDDVRATSRIDDVGRGADRSTPRTR